MTVRYDLKGKPRYSAKAEKDEQQQLLDEESGLNKD